MRWNEIAYTSFSRAACQEAARRASAIVGIDASDLQKNGAYATLHALALRAIDIDRKSLLDPDSSDGRKFIQSACGAAPNRERGTLGERVGDALAAWDVHRARLGLNSSFFSNYTWGRYAPKCVPDVSCDPVTSYDFVMTDPPHGSEGLASRKNAVFYAVKGLFSSLFTPIGESQKNYLHASEFSDQNLSKSVPAPPYSKNSLIRIAETMTASDDTHHSTRHANILPELLLDHKTVQVNDLRHRQTCSLTMTHGFQEAIEAYELAKNLYGKLDFTDILLRFLGVSVTSDLLLVTNAAAAPPVVNGITQFIADEAQDFSPLLACVAERLSEAADDVFLLGDPRQSVYAFAGSTGHLMRSYDGLARSTGTSTLLNVSYRNPDQILHWGECVLREDSEYQSRNPVSAAYEDGVIREGSATLVKWEDFLSYLPELACSDVLVLSRTWFTLLPVKERLDSLGVPWRSCQEKQSSRWECPAKIAYTIALRDLERGELISEQDWRRITDTLPQKLDGIDLFVRGTKAKWKKAVCSPVVSKGIHQIHEWGATEAFIDFVLLGHWRREMPALLDSAIEKYGLDVVRKPRIRLGSVHSVKGLEARNVFCLSASTVRASGDEADFNEEICLKYVAITRASKNYRLVVNVNDIARSKPQFWAAPRGYWEFDSEPPQGHFREPEAEKPKDDGYFGPVRSEDTGEDTEMDWEFGI